MNEAFIVGAICVGLVAFLGLIRLELKLLK